MVEFDGRPGSINEAVKSVMEQWLAVLVRKARTAIEAGELAPDTDPEDVAFTLSALAVGANCDFLLTRSPTSLERVRRAMAEVLAPPGTAQHERRR